MPSLREHEPKLWLLWPIVQEQPKASEDVRGWGLLHVWPSELAQ